MDPSIPSPPPTMVGGAEGRDWAELPWDALSVIFEKIGVVEVLVAAQAVCRPWRKLAFEPRLWRRIDMTGWVWEFSSRLDLEKMAAAAVERSDGCLVELSVAEVATDELLKFIAERRLSELVHTKPIQFNQVASSVASFALGTHRSKELKHLCLICCYKVSDMGLIEASKNLSLLEELEISNCSLNGKALEYVGRSCPKLKCFRLNGTGVRYPHSQCNEEALAIAKNMPGLRELQLFGNRLDCAGLHALLEGCPDLESLDLRHCFQLNFDEALKDKCKRLKTLRLPKDSTNDYPHDTYYAGSEYDTDNDYDFYGYDDYDFDDYEDYDDFTRPELSAVDLMFADMFFDHDVSDEGFFMD